MGQIAQRIEEKIKTNVFNPITPEDNNEIRQKQEYQPVTINK